MFNWETQPHRRHNPLTGDWVLVSPQRTQRPWQGETEAPAPLRPAYDPECYLCPGNARAEGHRNPAYTSVFAFDNDFPTLIAGESPREPAVKSSDLLIAEPERGRCRVMCFSPRHDLSLPGLSLAEVHDVVNAWRAESAHLGSLPFINYVQIFENRGAMAGASNPHPHCQIWAGETIPNEIAREDRSQSQYFQQHHSCLLCDYAALERGGARAVYENESFLTLVPFWAVWPFETLIISKRHAANLAALRDQEAAALADALKQITTRYDNLFDAEFPYSLGVHQEPSDGRERRSWHLHLHFYPPLLRSATVRKFLVGYEMLAMPQRDLTAESAAERLRSAAGPK